MSGTSTSRHLRPSLAPLNISRKNAWEQERGLALQNGWLPNPTGQKRVVELVPLVDFEVVQILRPKCNKRTRAQ